MYTDANDPYPEVTIHQFKSNIAAYLRALEEERHRGIIIKRYDRPVAAVIAYSKDNKSRGR